MWLLPEIILVLDSYDEQTHSSTVNFLVQNNIWSPISIQVSFNKPNNKFMIVIVFLYPCFCFNYFWQIHVGFRPTLTCWIRTCNSGFCKAKTLQLGGGCYVGMHRQWCHDPLMCNEQPGWPLQWPTCASKDVTGPKQFSEVRVITHMVWYPFYQLTFTPSQQTHIGAGAHSQSLWEACRSCCREHVTSRDGNGCH